MAKRKAQPMDESELIALVNQYVENAYYEDSSDSTQGSQVNEDRKRAIKAYNLDPTLIPFKPGYSQVVTGDVFEVIEWAKPNLLRIFAASDRAVEFTPQGPEDVPAAKQATEVANYIMFRQNPGFKIFHDWFHDALLEKLGVVKWGWKTEEKMVIKSFEGLTKDELDMILAESDDNVELVEMTEETLVGEDGFQQESISAKFGIKQTHGYVCVENIPPEDFLIDMRATCIDDAQFVGHVARYTKSDLQEMFPDADLEDLAGDGESWGVYDDLKSLRRGYTSVQEQYIANEDSEASKPFYVVECYVRVDADGDGKTELRKIIKAGNTVFHNEEFPCAPYADLCPIPLPHRYIGRSYADVVFPLQQTNTSVLRGIIDNINLTNHPRYTALDGRVNLQDLMNLKTGGVVRTKDPAAVGVLQLGVLNPDTFNLINYTDKLKERRTGVSESTQGLNDDTLTSHVSANAIAQVSENSGQKAELLARHFAETGIKRLYLGVYRCFVENADGPQRMRLMNDWVDVDPYSLIDRADMCINVGLGYGNKQERQQKAQMVYTVAQQMLANPMTAKMVNPLKLYQSIRTMFEAADIKNVDEFILSPQEIQQSMQQGPSPQEQMQMQMMKLDLQQKDADTKKTQAEAQKISTEAQVRLQEIQANLEAKKLDLQMKQLELQIKQMDAQARVTESNLRVEDARLQVQEQQARSMENAMRLDLDKQKAEVDAMVDLGGLEIDREELKIKEMVARQKPEKKESA